MKKISTILFLAISIFSFTSCEEDSEFFSAISEDEEIASGLRAALAVGTDTASGNLSKEDGYFTDLAVKLLLPNELNTAITSFKEKSVNLGITTVTGETLYKGYSNSLLGINIPSLQSKEDALILGINRAAEAAAKESGPIFKSAITSMSITDATGILYGEDTAATAYLRSTSYDSLFNKFEPKIDNALNSIKISDKSVVALYEDYVNTYNSVLNTSAGTASIGSLMSINTIKQTDLSAYSTNKGLNGLFLKVSEEEKNIRENPLARVTDLLEKVFSKLD